MPTADLREHLRAELLAEWPDGAIPRWWIQDEAQARSLNYGDFWQAVALLGFRIVPSARPDGSAGQWLPIPRPRGSRIKPEVLAAFARQLRRSDDSSSQERELAPLVGPTSPTARILAVLEERYPCKLAPRGTWRALGKEIGVSGERVRQVATEAGWSLVPRPPRLYQCACGRVQRSARLCNDCRWVELPCEECGMPQKLSAATLATRTAHHPGPFKYTGRVFCNRSCFGRWVGKNHVGRDRPAKRERLRMRLEESYPERIAPWGAWRRVAAELGLPYGWVVRGATELGWRREEPASKTNVVR